MRHDNAINAPSAPPARQIVVSLLMGGCALITILLWILWKPIYISFHEMGLERAATQYEAKMDGKLAEEIRFDELNEDINWHRRALIRAHQLVYRRYRFEHVQCPSDQAQWLEEQFLKRNGGRYHAVHSSWSTWGCGSDGEFTINLWCSPDFVAGWDDFCEKLLSVLNVAQKGMKTAGVTFAGIALEDLYKAAGKRFRSPIVATDHRLGNRQRHLGVVGVTARSDAVARMLDVTA